MANKKSAFDKRVIKALKHLGKMRAELKSTDYEGMDDNQIRDLQVLRNVSNDLSGQLIFHVGNLRLIPQKDLAEALGLSQPTVSLMISRRAKKK